MKLRNGTTFSGRWGVGIVDGCSYLRCVLMWTTDSEVPACVETCRIRLGAWRLGRMAQQRGGAEVFIVGVLGIFMENMQIL